MEKLTLDIIEVANGGSGVARANRGRTVFVPMTIPGEKIRAEVHTEKNKTLYADVAEVLRPSPDRIEPTCQHFGVCGGCHFQHIQYEAQLTIKRDVIVDQLERIGNIKNVPVLRPLAAPRPWHYRQEMVLSPVPEGGLGYWSPKEKQVVPIAECPVTRPELLELLQDIDLDLPGLRKLTLRLGDDEALLAAIEVDGVEPPQMEANFPLSVAIVLPDQTAVNLFGDNFNVQTINGRDFRVTPGCHFYTSPEAAGLIVDTVLHYANLNGSETVLELHSGVGTFTSFLAEGATAVTAVEQNPDAVADTAVNLDVDNVTLYEGEVEAVLPQLSLSPDLAVAHPPASGMSREALAQLTAKKAKRIIYVSSDVATFARDGRDLSKAGYQLQELQPIDTHPQTYHVDMVGLWEMGD